MFLNEGIRCVYLVKKTGKKTNNPQTCITKATERSGKTSLGKRRKGAHILRYHQSTLVRIF